MAMGVQPLRMIENDGGPGRVRTDDLFHAMEARSQLRHRPTGEREKLNPILAQPPGIVKRLLASSAFIMTPQSERDKPAM